MAIVKLGRHIIAEFYGCDSTTLSDRRKIQKFLVRAAEKAELTIIKVDSHSFEPGATTFMIIGESHLAIHTWPEFGYASIDIYVCYGRDPWPAFEELRRLLKPQDYVVNEITRGMEIPERMASATYGIVDTLAPAMYVTYVPRRVLYRKEGIQKIEVIEHEILGRCLFLDGRLQVAEYDEFMYHEVLVHPVMFAHPDPRSILIIGGGDGGALREVLKHNTVERVAVVEIDKSVIEFSRKYIPSVNRGAFDDERVEYIFTDGREFVKREGDKFDVAIIDVTDPHSGLSIPIFTREFHMDLKRRMREGGIVSQQAEDVYLYHTLHKVNFPSIYRTFESVYRYVRGGRCWVPSYSSEWAFTYGSDLIDPMNIDEEELKRRMKEREVETEYYTPEIHRALMTFPKFVQNQIRKYGEILHEKQPLVEEVEKSF
ncbi:hypothetical protein B6U74_02780 [Candidatus Bathyarchaeota archaeon ex4484_205]|nr:MAG: hypothetical protein B6U74_02780 [Candidatus Bathyarchaeota archaeon ex4484_205]RLG68974.1 MAG: hypothetical protein DRN93_01410 [archaeon]